MPSRYRDPEWKHDYMRDLGFNLANLGLSETEAAPHAEHAMRVMLVGSAKTDMGDRADHLIWLCQAERKRREDQIGIIQYRIRCAVRPLFEAGADKARIENAARHANSDKSDALDWSLIVPVLIDEAHRIRRRSRRKAA